MPTYADLHRRNPDYDCAKASRLRAVYEGDEAFRAKLSEFLPQRPSEPGVVYALRCKEANYRNYVGPIIDFFTALLFSSRPRVVANDAAGAVIPEPDAFYSEFRDDADGQGADIDSVFKTLLTTAMVGGCAWLQLHQPDDEQAPAASLKEFEERGLGKCWVTPIDPDRVIDWDVDDSGKLSWVLVHSITAKRQGLESSRDMITERWEHIQQSTIDIYEITYRKDDKPADTKLVQLVGTKAHSFGRVPMLQMVVPKALHVASRLEMPQLSHFRLSTGLNWSLAVTCYAQPVFHLRNDESKPTMGAGYGIFIGIDEKMEWAAPPTGHFDALRNEIAAQKDEIFRIAQQMALGVDNNAAAVGRSGESKHQDAMQTKVVLLGFSRLVKEAIEVVYEMIGASRGDEIKWSIEGLDDFASADLYGLLKSWIELKDAGDIPSNTFKAEMYSRMADALLPDLAQSVKLKVREEITAGVVAEAEAVAKANAEADALSREIGADLKKKNSEKRAA